MSKPIFAAFDRGQVPLISVINKATVPLGVDFAKLVAALQSYVATCVVPVWGTPAVLSIAKDFVAGTWALLLLDDPDVANAYGYHDMTPDGFPLSKVFVKTCLQYGELVSVTASHEVTEMLVDPAINLCAQAPNGVIYAYESVDPCEALSFAVNGIPMSDFVFPSWFEGFRAPKSTQFDYMKRVTAPFQLLPGGYAIVFKRGRWTQLYGSKEKRSAFAKEDRRGHRSEYRMTLKL